MSNLHEKNCNDLPEELGALDNSAIEIYLERLNELANPQWHLSKDNSELINTFTFKNYYQTIAFVNIIAQISHQQDHHPDLQVSYNRCVVTLSTHSVEGISLKDFICAAKINAAQSL